LILEMYLNVEVNERNIQWEPSCLLSRADRHDEAKSLLSQFCERAKNGRHFELSKWG
jgi:hypothetical protein